MALGQLKLLMIGYYIANSTQLFLSYEPIEVIVNNYNKKLKN